MAAIEYPRTYRYALWLTIPGALLGLAFAGGALAGAVAIALSHRSFATGEPPLALFGCLALAAFGAWILVSVLRARIVLTADSVTLYGAFTRRDVARADITGRRTIPLQYGQKLTVLSLRDPQAKALKLPQGLRTDATWDAWLASLPDLDAQAVRDLEAEVAANPELGQTPQERLAKLATARRLARGASFATYAAAAWGYFYPLPYGLALLTLAALPWLALVVVAKSRGLYRVDSQRNDPRPTLALPIMLPGFALLLRALRDVEVLELPSALVYAALVAALLAWAAWLSDAALRARRSAVLLLFAVGCAYGYGVVVLGDAELDRGPGSDFRVVVLGQHLSRGSRSTTYYLRLDRWGARTEPADVSVSHDLYMQSAPGSTVCIHEGPGALAIPWYQVLPCAAPRG
jgi:hypothetical protein